MMSVMKIWIQEEKTATHHIAHLNLEHHGNFEYLGDLNEEEQHALLTKIKPDIDLEKNLKMLKYFGYLHLFVIQKKD
jgi:hypothetical protein